MSIIFQSFKVNRNLYCQSIYFDILYFFEIKKNIQINNVFTFSAKNTRMIKEIKMILLLVFIYHHLKVYLVILVLIEGKWKTRTKKSKNKYVEVDFLTYATIYSPIFVLYLRTFSLYVYLKKNNYTMIVFFTKIFVQYTFQRKLIQYFQKIFCSSKLRNNVKITFYSTSQHPIFYWSLILSIKRYILEIMRGLKQTFLI